MYVCLSVCMYVCMCAFCMGVLGFKQFLGLRNTKRGFAQKNKTWRVEPNTNIYPKLILSSDDTLTCFDKPRR